MVTLLEEATVFIISIFYQYFITLLILYIHWTKVVCLLIASYQRALLYLLCCVLVCVLSPAWAFLLSFSVWFSVTLWLFYSYDMKLSFFSFCIYVNLWHDFEIKQENLFWVCHHYMEVSLINIWFVVTIYCSCLLHPNRTISYIFQHCSFFI